MSDQVGMQLGAYRLYEKIGGGGFATVYVARDTRTNELVAIKVLHPHLSQDAQFIARFRREAETLQKIPPHPNIVGLREFGQQAGTYYLVMEYLQGKDVAQILAERKRLPVNEAITIALQVAQALDVAHRHGLVHRDIKPANIKLTPQGVVKVMDFGIARATEGTQLTQSGTFVGTPDYIAPEIWEGKPADIRADIYALGALLYEILTGNAPFHSDTPAAVMRRHLMEQPHPIRSTRADVPANVDAVVAKMMAKDPTARYQTPAEVIWALQNLLGGNAPTAIQKPPEQLLPRQRQKQNSIKVTTLLPVTGIIFGVFVVCLVLMVFVTRQSQATQVAIVQPSPTNNAVVVLPTSTAVMPTATRLAPTAPPMTPTTLPISTATPLTLLTMQPSAPSTSVVPVVKTLVAIPTEVIPLLGSGEKNNWEPASVVFANICGASGQSWCWNLFVANPGSNVSVRSTVPYVAWYRFDFAKIQSYTAELAWLLIDSAYLYPNDDAHGYGIAFTTQDGAQWRFQLSMKNNQLHYAFTALSTPNVPEMWVPCGDCGIANLYSNPVLTVRYKDDGNAEVLLNGKLLGVGTGISPRQKLSPIKLGLVIFGIPARARILRAEVAVQREASAPTLSATGTPIAPVVRVTATIPALAQIVSPQGDLVYAVEPLKRLVELFTLQPTFDFQTFYDTHPEIHCAPPYDKSLSYVCNSVRMQWGELSPKPLAEIARTPGTLTWLTVFLDDGALSIAGLDQLHNYRGRWVLVRGKTQTGLARFDIEPQGFVFVYDYDSVNYKGIYLQPMEFRNP